MNLSIFDWLIGFIHWLIEMGFHSLSLGHMEINILYRVSSNSCWSCCSNSQIVGWWVWAAIPGCRAFSFYIGYSSVCDRQRKATPPSLLESSKEALELEQKHVHHVYDEIASHFSSTRHSPWPRIVEFLKALPSGSIVADIGCGNGKYLGINKELYMASNCATLIFFLT